MNKAGTKHIAIVAYAALAIHLAWMLSSDTMHVHTWSTEPRFERDKMSILIGEGNRPKLAEHRKIEVKYCLTCGDIRAVLGDVTK